MKRRKGWRMRTAHSTTFPSVHLCHSAFSNPSVTLPMSQLILQLFFCFSYITGSSLMSPGEPPMSQISRSPARCSYQLSYWGTPHNLATNPSLSLSFFPRLSDWKHLYSLSIESSTTSQGFQLGIYTHLLTMVWLVCLNCELNKQTLKGDRAALT